MRKLGLVVTFLAIFIAGYFLGHVVSSKRFQKVNELIAWNNKLSLYVQMRNISSYIKSGQINVAKCNADLLATTEHDYLIQCLKKNACSNYQLELVKKLAPELTTDQLSFSEVQSCDVGK